MSVLSMVCYCNLRLTHQAQREAELCPSSLEMVKFLNFQKL